MDDPRESDIMKTQIDFADLSAQEQSAFAMAAGIDDDSLYPVELSKGFCVKEFEEKLQSLTKENFNLKLRIYFLEDKNPNIPLGAEAIYKQNIDLKVENDSLLKDLQEKQDLLCQASKALELLDQEKLTDNQRSQMKIDELNQKIESLNHEVSSLQNALVDANKSTLGNDTGYADFLGAVDSKDVERQRLAAEFKEAESNFNAQMNAMNETLQKLQLEKKEIETKASKLYYDNKAMKDNLASLMKNKSDELQMKNLEKELREFKDKWAATQCDLQDAEDKLKETEHEREKTLRLLQSSLAAHEEKNMKIIALESQLELMTSGDHKKFLSQKNNEIAKLQSDLSEAKRNFQQMANQELKEKNREIEKLTDLVKSLKSEKSNSMSQATRFSIEQLSDSFNGLHFQQAMEQKKQSQMRIGQLMNTLSDVAHVQTKQHVDELKAQMAIVVQKQEVTDTALEKCAELCGVTLEHLHDLANFLSALLQQKEIRESLSELTVFNIQSAINRTLEMSNHANRFSVDGRFSLLLNDSSLGLLLDAARQSMAGIRDIQSANKSIQASFVPQDDMEWEKTKKELDDLSSVNQVLEDEIISLKEQLEKQKEYLMKRDAEIKESSLAKQLLLADVKAARILIDDLEKTLESRVQSAQANFEDLKEKYYQLEKILQQETIKKIDFENRATASEKMAATLTTKLNTLQMDLGTNWITKSQHDSILMAYAEKLKNSEAEMGKIKTDEEILRNAKEDMLQSLTFPDDKLVPIPSHEQQPRRTLEISEERRRLLTSIGDSNVASSTDPAACEMCPKYQAKIVELKKYLGRAVEKIKSQEERKVLNDQNIQKQLSKTESFLHTARSNMENILKVRNENQE